MAESEETDKPNALTPDLRRDIDFSHVSFSYDGGAPVLSDVSLHIPAGSTLGILGGTGSGKSTLVELLARLYPLGEGQGNIAIGGVNIADMKRTELRRGVGIVLQEPFLFSRTLKENIAITDDSSTMNDIRTASAIACLDETIEKFTDGYDTAVGERGVTLSGGQKQRTAIARLLMQKTPIMVFDDSLSAVDTETDAKIRHALKEKMAGATVILISHRITTLMGADKIAVLDHGRLTECGTHEELMAQGGIYRKIADIQFGNAGEVRA